MYDYRTLVLGFLFQLIIEGQKTADIFHMILSSECRGVLENSNWTTLDPNFYTYPIPNAKTSTDMKQEVVKPF